MDRSEGIESHSKRLSYLFTKIEPLARTRREGKKNCDLTSILKDSLSIFEKDIEDNHIDIFISSDIEGIEIYGVKVDLMTIMSNLIENSIYWLNVSDNSIKKIAITLFERIDNSCESVVIEVLDNGLGFKGADISQIFDAGYSNKFHDAGTGLGLTISGESVGRFEKGKIEAVASTQGACFHITLPTKK
jgi:signal transduction histidine kinase